MSYCFLKSNSNSYANKMSIFHIFVLEVDHLWVVILFLNTVYTRLKK